MGQRGSLRLLARTRNAGPRQHEKYVGGPGLMRSRLAPSPTGAQHLGNARTHLIAYWATRQAGGELVFRIDDLDSPRVKPWAIDQAVEDVRWLGIDWDGPVVLQSRH